MPLPREVIVMFEDETLVCKECGKEFVFTAGEKEFFAEKGLQNKPVRCPECRQARKERRRASRQMYDIICSECGAEDQVPFKPNLDKPVYCSNCFEKHLNEAAE